MHAGAVVADDGLGHEGRGLAVGVGDVLHDVLQDLRPVGALGQRVEHGADFALAGGRHFVVEHFDRDAGFFQRQHHGGADVLQAVDRGHGEVAALHAGTVAGVAGLEFFSRRPGRFFGIDFHAAARHVVVPGDGIENEELGFGAEVGGVGDAGRLQIGFGAPGHRTRVALVALAVGRLDHVAGQDQRGLVKEGVHVGRIGIGFQQHVGGLNAFPASDRGAVERVAVLKPVFGHDASRNRNVLLLAAGIGKAQVNEFHFVVLNHLDHVYRTAMLNLLKLK